MAVNRIPVEGPPVFTAYLRDITGRKRNEQSLMDAMEEAELQRENAQRANLAKSQFLSRMSHELRTPLNAILGFGQLLETSPLSEPDQQSVQQIMKAGSHLLDLIDEVLDISRIESGNLGISLEAVNVREICADALALVKPLAAQRSITCEMNLDDCETKYIAADNQRIKQALLNLLSNAVKYNCEGGCISLHVSESRSDYLRISVKDTGHGIAPEKMDRLFTPFDRLDAEATGVEGTGIGLAIAHRMVEAMNGTLGVDSEAGAGSTFWLEMPQALNPLLDASPATYEYSDDVSTQSIVLYIDENLLNFDLMQRIVSYRPNLKLLFAQNGDLGIELARRYRPTLIFLDLHLPEISGEDVLQQLRLEPETREIPVVVISADATSGQRECLMQAGADDYLTKPLDMYDLLRIIDQKIMGQQLPF
jgi:nitrogen-specific signal transduction histidine kinase/CheY-like chemotaxis protein